MNSGESYPTFTTWEKVVAGIPSDSTTSVYGCPQIPENKHTNRWLADDVAHAENVWEK
jgi:hypothetical protein